MNELAAALREHASRYPLMLPLDAVKVVYQNEFGGGHLITDTGESLVRLETEYALAGWDAATPLLESIGNDMARLHLAAAKAQGIPAGVIHKLFVRSAARPQGTQEAFEAKLATLASAAAADVFCFTIGDLERYLDEYAKAGYPVVSHSAAYRAAYRPAYRVVKTQYCRF